MSNRNMTDAGWVWEGLAFNPGHDPSVYGVGEGVTYFGLDKANFLFHPNNETNLRKLSHVSEVTADISKWVWEPADCDTHRFTFAQRHDGDPETVLAEAEKVSSLSLQFPNIVAAYIDDTHGIAARDNYTADTPREIKQTVCSHNPDLDLWIVVYTHEFDNTYWQDWRPHVDVINLWVWNSGDLPHTDEYIARCREVFPDKRIVMGIYMRDYPLIAPVSLDMLEIQMTAIARNLDTGTLDGYSILCATLIDTHPEQAEFIRDFIHSH